MLPVECKHDWLVLPALVHMFAFVFVCVNVYMIYNKGHVLSGLANTVFIITSTGQTHGAMSRVCKSFADLYEVIMIRLY